MDRRIIDLQDLDGVIAAVERLSRDGYAKAGTWGLGEVSCHCGQFIEGCLNGFDFKAPWLLRQLGPLIFKSIVKKRGFKPGFRKPLELPSSASQEEQEHGRPPHTVDPTLSATSGFVASLSALRSADPSTMG